MKRKVWVPIVFLCFIASTFGLSTCGGGDGPKIGDIDDDLITTTVTLGDGCELIVEAPVSVTCDTDLDPSDYPAGSIISPVRITGTLSSGQTAKLTFKDTTERFEENDSIMYVDSEGKWSLVSSSVSSDVKSISATVDHFSIWGVMEGGLIHGTIVDSVGGSPVAAAIITVSGTGFSTTSDDNGEFYINVGDVPTGTYDILVSKTGRAGSKLQEISFSSATKVEIVQTEYNFSSTSVTSPTINVSGISAGNTYNGSSIPITITVTAGSYPVVGTYDHPSILLKIGSNSGYMLDAYSDTDTLNYSWDTSYFPPGNINIKVIAYDNNNNRSELNIPVIVGDTSGSPPAFIPTSSDYEVYAVTFGQSLHLFRQEIDTLLAKSIIENKVKLTLLKIKDDITIFSAPADSTAFVDIWVDYYSGTRGINVYRSIDQNGNYTLAGKTSFYDDYWDQYFFEDMSSVITPGQSVWYRISYYNEYGDGPLSDPIEVRILPKYNLNLTSPSNSSTTTDTTPTFQWSSGTISGADRYDLVVVKEVTGDYIWESSLLLNQTQVVCGTLLTYNKLYEWNVISQYEYYNGSVMSLSFPSTSSNSTNGTYYFSVIQP